MAQIVMTVARATPSRHRRQSSRQRYRKTCRSTLPRRHHLRRHPLHKDRRRPCAWAVPLESHVAFASSQFKRQTAQTCSQRCQRATRGLSPGHSVRGMAAVTPTPASIIAVCSKSTSALIAQASCLRARRLWGGCPQGATTSAATLQMATVTTDRQAPSTRIAPLVRTVSTAGWRMCPPRLRYLLPRRHGRRCLPRVHRRLGRLRTIPGAVTHATTLRTATAMTARQVRSTTTALKGPTASTAG